MKFSICLPNKYGRGGVWASAYPYRHGAVTPCIFAVDAVQYQGVYLLYGAFAYFYVAFGKVAYVVYGFRMVDGFKCSRIDLPEIVTPSFTTSSVSCRVSVFPSMRLLS